MLPHRVEIKHGGLELGELDGGDADGPDVTLLVVPALPLHGGHLRRHPAHIAAVMFIMLQFRVSLEFMLSFQYNCVVQD